MRSEIATVTAGLRDLGVSPSIIKLVRDDASKARAPILDASVTDRLRAVAGEHHRAMLVLSRNGGYSVFSMAGHAALCASAKKNKPWVARNKQRKASKS